MIPTLGRIVHYTLSAYDATQINKRRLDFDNYRRFNPAYTDTGYAAHSGNQVAEGDTFPAVIVRVWGDTEQSAVNLQVFLDGTDAFWVTSVSVGEGPRRFAWPPRV